VGSHNEYYKKENLLKSHEWVNWCQELFSINSDRIVEGLEETQSLGLSYVAELDRDLTKAEGKEFILKMKNNEASGCDWIPADFRNIFCIRRDGIKTLTNQQWERISTGL
jgi:hypothetical protein